MKITVHQYCALRFKEMRIRPQTEFKFHPGRKWRFDFAFLLGKNPIAVEAEGGMYVKSRHRTGTGYIHDCEKYYNAVMLGWRVLRVATIAQVDEIIPYLCAEQDKYIKTLKTQINDK